MIEANISDTVAGAVRGVAGDIGRLYELYRADIFRYLYYRVGDQHAAEDLTSEVFLRMIRALDGYRPQSVAFQAWLFQIARNIAIDHYRKMRLRNHQPLDENLVDPSGVVDQSIERKLTSDVLRLALEKLNETQRDVIILRFVNNLSIAQVAQTLHKSQDSIKALQRRALSALRDILLDWEVVYGTDG